MRQCTGLKKAASDDSSSRIKELIRGCIESTCDDAVASSSDEDSNETTSGFELQDRFAGGSFSGHAGVAFNFDGSTCAALDENWGDFGLIPLDPLTVSQLSAGMTGELNKLTSPASAFEARPSQERARGIVSVFSRSPARSAMQRQKSGACPRCPSAPPAKQTTTAMFPTHQSVNLLTLGRTAQRSPKQPNGRAKRQ